MDFRENFCITNLSVEEHFYKNYHFCRGNNSKRKNRIGLILSGKADFMYLDKKISINENDVIFIPEKIFCYSEWTGDPDIKVIYISFDVENGGLHKYFSLQTLPKINDEGKNTIKEVCKKLKGDLKENLEAYSLFYTFLAQNLKAFSQNENKLDDRLYTALDYITSNWNKDFSVKDIAKKCLISESKLYHLFQGELGQTPISYMNNIKINYAIQYLETGKYTISQVCNLTNFHSEVYFRKVFKKITGSNPSYYKK